MIDVCFFIPLQSCDLDLEKEVHSLKQAAPFLIFSGEPGTESAQYFVVCEQNLLCESKSVVDSILDLVATYYVFDIVYPKAIAPVIMFFHTYIFGLKNNQTVPPSTAKLVDNLSRM